MLKRDYSVNEWDLREQYYIDKVTRIVLPQIPTIVELQSIAAQVDTMLTEAYFDKATVYKKLELSKSQVSRTEAQAWIKIDTLKLEQEKGKKLLKEEKEGLVKAFMENQKFEGTDISINKYYDEMKNRAHFIDSVISTLKNKSGVVLNHISLLKLENDLSK